MALTKTRINKFDKGLNKDTPTHLLRDDECAELNNAVHRSGEWTKRDGYTDPYTDTGDALNVIEVVDYIEAGVSTLLRGTKDGIDYLNGTTWTKRLNLGVTRADTDKWFFAEGNSLSWAVNGVDSVYTTVDPSATNYTAITWDTATVGSSAGTTVTRANVVLFLNNRVYLCNVTDGVDGSQPSRVRFTNALDYDRTEASTGFYQWDDTQSGIISAGTLLNNAIALFKEDMVNIVQNTGNPVLSPQLRFTPGLLAPKAWTYIPGGGIFYISPTGFHMFQNGLPEEVGRNKIRKYFFTQLDESTKSNVYCWTNWQEAEIVIHYPVSGTAEPSKVLVYNWAIGAWSEWDYLAYCGFYRFRDQTATNIYYGSSSGIVKLNDGTPTTDGGSTITTTLTTKAFTPKDLLRLSELKSSNAVPNYIQVNDVYTNTRPVGATIKVGEADYGNETPTYSSTATITEEAGLQPFADLTPAPTAYLSISVTGFTTVSEFIVGWTGSGDQ